MAILNTIKEETKTHHQQVEKVLVQELKNLKNKDDYARLLERLLLFYKPIEVDLHEVIDDALIPDISERKHTQRILTDLELLEHGLPMEFPKSQLKISSPSYALGVLYVIEGSTLGGQVISKMIHNHLYLEGVDATNYFGSYKELNGDMWKKFGDRISEIENSVDQKELFQGAKDTFDSLKYWLETTKKPSESTSV
jgi:heme oxygenase|nr:biliverdin-producing heme oxygenase [uncultured Allomuricauda sp.]